MASTSGQGRVRSGGVHNLHDDHPHEHPSDAEGQVQAVQEQVPLKLPGQSKRERGRERVKGDEREREGLPLILFSTSGSNRPISRRVRCAERISRKAIFGLNRRKRGIWIFFYFSVLS